MDTCELPLSIALPFFDEDTGALRAGGITPGMSRHCQVY